ncbi:MAG: Malate dehydrogenase, partial [uncultured Pseudonocardia sp.]
ELQRHPRQGRRHRRRRPDRLRPAVPHRLGRHARPRHPGAPAPARDPARRQGRRGHRDGARRLRVPAAEGHPHLRRPQAGVRRRQRRAARGRAAAHEGHGARRSARGQRRHLQAAGPGAQRGRRRRREDPRGRQPGEHERADRPVQRARHPARALHGDDPPRPQ